MVPHAVPPHAVPPLDAADASPTGAAGATPTHAATAETAAPPPAAVADEPLERALALVAAARPRCGQTLVVAVDGPSGAGKSTFAAALAARLGGPQVLHMDDIYPGWHGLADAVPHLHDWVVAPLARGERAAYRRFDWDAGAYAEWHDVPAAPVLVVEGVGSGAHPVAQYVSVLVWVEAERDVRFARGIERDGEAYLPYWQRWAVQEEAHFATEGTRARADLVLDTTLPAAP